MLFAELLDPPCRFGSFSRDVDDATQEEREPGLPSAQIPNGLEVVVVLLAVPLEVVREVKDRLVQDASFREEERDQQTADAPVAVEERVDRLELHMCQSDLDERRQVVGLVNELLEVAKRVGNDVMRRRHEASGVDHRTGRTDPVLARPKFSWLEFAAADALHEFGVNFADEPH